MWLDPMPREEDIGEAYENYHTPDAARAGWLRRIRARFMDAYVRHALGYVGERSLPKRLVLSALAALYPGGAAELARSAVFLDGPAASRHFLEIGCGRGELLGYLQGLGWTVEGVDLDPAGIEIARSRGVVARVGTAISHPGPNGSFDAISLVHVVEHLHDPIAVLRRCFDLLKPGGGLVVLTPNAASLGHVLFGKDWVHLDPPRHVILYRREALEDLAVKSGFSIVRSTSTAYGARSIPAFAWAIRRTGRGGKFGRHLSLSAHALGIPLQVAERAAIGVGWSVGEELLLIARKPDQAESD